MENSQQYPLLLSYYTSDRLSSNLALAAVYPCLESNLTENGLLTQSNMQAALLAGKILARSVFAPSAIHRKQHQTSCGQWLPQTLAAIEIRKAARRYGVATKSAKTNHAQKHGNLNRSTSLIGYGGGVFACSGFLIVKPKLHAIKQIHHLDVGSGFGKRAGLITSDLPVVAPQVLAERQIQYEKLHRRMMLGGKVEIFFDKYPARHNEIIYDIDEFHAIYFSQDPTLTNSFIYESAKPKNQYAPLLQAIYLQQEYEKAHQTKLPIFEYSMLRNQMIELDTIKYDAAYIIQMWRELIKDYIEENAASKFSFNCLLTMPLAIMKSILIYGGHKRANGFIKDFNAPDELYNETLKKSVNLSLLLEINLAIKRQPDYILDKYHIFKFIAELYAYHPDCFADQDFAWLADYMSSTEDYAAMIEYIPSAEQEQFAKTLATYRLQQKLLAEDVDQHRNDAQRAVPNEADNGIANNSAKMQAIAQSESYPMQGMSSCVGLFGKNSSQRLTQASKMQMSQALPQQSIINR
jgi:hypothetical protein